MNTPNPLRFALRGLAAMILALPLLAFAGAPVNDNFDGPLTLTLYTVSTNSAPVETGSTSTYGQGLFPAGATDTVMAYPVRDYTFVNWTENGNVVSSSTNYTFQVTANRELTANYTWIPVPENDNFANRLPITGTAALSANTTHASGEPGEPSFPTGPNPGGKSVWWTWTPSVSGTAGLQILNCSFSPRIAIFSGSTLATLGRLASSWGNPGTFQFNVTKGTAYQIMVDDPAGQGGAIDFTMISPAGPKFEIPWMVEASNHTIEVPIFFDATGDETSLAWSVTFEPTMMKHPRVVPGKGVGTFSVDASQAANGLLGIRLQLPPGHTLSYGIHELARIRFSRLSVPGDWILGFDFGDSPVARLITDRFGDTPAGIYSGGSIIAVQKGAIQAWASPSEGGVVEGTGEFAAGSVRSITAIPTRGWKFMGWDDGVKTPTRWVKVVPAGNNYTAIFEPNERHRHPFKGSYLGSLDGQAGTQVRIALGASGAFTGSVTIYGSTFRFHGRLDSEGNYDGPVNDLPGWQLSFYVDQEYGEIYGSIGDFGLNVTRSLWDSYGNTRALAGRYTMLLLPGNRDQGSGYGLLTLGEHGEVRAIGKMCDGSPFAQSTMLNRESNWSLYAPLHGGAGYLSGEISYNYGDPQGNAIWHIPPQPQSEKYYSGADVPFNVHAARFTPGAWLSDQLLNTPVTMTDINSNSVYSDMLTLSPRPNDLATVPDSNGRSVTLRLNPKNGMLTGDMFGFYKDSAGQPKHTPFSGVILQEWNLGGGYFLQGEAAGRVDLNISDAWW